MSLSPPQRMTEPVGQDCSSDPTPRNTPAGSSVAQYFRQEALDARRRLVVGPHPRVPVWLLVADALFLLASLAAAAAAFWFTRVSGS
jgi:hypothetical protein